MWDLIVSVPDHCLSFYFSRFLLYVWCFVCICTIVTFCSNTLPLELVVLIVGFLEFMLTFILQPARTQAVLSIKSGEYSCLFYLFIYS